MAVNSKLWANSREVCRANDVHKTTKTADVLMQLCFSENYTKECHLRHFISETNLLSWPKGSQKYKYYTNEEGMYELLFFSQEPKIKVIY